MPEPIKMNEPIYGVVLTDGQQVGITEWKPQNDLFACARNAIHCDMEYFSNQRARFDCRKPRNKASSVKATSRRLFSAHRPNSGGTFGSQTTALNKRAGGRSTTTVAKAPAAAQANDV